MEENQKLEIIKLHLEGESRERIAERFGLKMKSRENCSGGTGTIWQTSASFLPWGDTYKKTS